MISPSPLQLMLWRTALYTELAAGFWRVLAAPWLEPGRPGPACAPAGAPAPATVDQPRLPQAPAEHRVIEVPRGRWQHRRGVGRQSPAAG